VLAIFVPNLQLHKSPANWAGEVFKPDYGFDKSSSKGVTTGRKVGTIPRRWITMETMINCGGAEKSQQCRKYFLQYSAFASERPQVLTWGRQTCFLPQSPYLVTPLLLVQIKKFSFSFWVCDSLQVTLQVGGCHIFGRV